MRIRPCLNLARPAAYASAAQPRLLTSPDGVRANRAPGANLTQAEKPMSEGASSGGLGVQVQVHWSATAAGGWGGIQESTGTPPDPLHFVSLQNTYYAKFKTWGQRRYAAGFPAEVPPRPPPHGACRPAGRGPLPRVHPTNDHCERTQIDVGATPGAPDRPFEPLRPRRRRYGAAVSR